MRALLSELREWLSCCPLWCADEDRPWHRNIANFAADVEARVDATIKAGGAWVPGGGNSAAAQYRRGLDGIKRTAATIRHYHGGKP